MVLDVIFSSLLLFAFYKGYKKGLVVAVFSLIAVVLALYTGLELVGLTSVYIDSHFAINSKYLPFVSFLFVFIGVILLVRLIAFLIDRFLKIILLGTVNKLAGGFLGMFLMALILSGLIWLCNQVHIISPEMKSKSIIFSYIENIYPFIMGNIPVLKDALTKLEGIFKNYMVMN